MYQGRDPVNGFYVDIKEADAPAEAWRGINTKATEKKYMKVAIVIRLSASSSSSCVTAAGV